MRLGRHARAGFPPKFLPCFSVNHHSITAAYSSITTPCGVPQPSLMCSTSSHRPFLNCGFLLWSDAFLVTTRTQDVVKRNQSSLICYCKESLYERWASLTRYDFLVLEQYTDTQSTWLWVPRREFKSAGTGNKVSTWWWLPAGDTVQNRDTAEPWCMLFLPGKELIDCMTGNRPAMNLGVCWQYGPSYGFLYRKKLTFCYSEGEKHINQVTRYNRFHY
jgi:hypothetical protein